MNKLSVGLTHTQYSLNNGGDPAALESAFQTLSAVPLQDQAIMGWGADNPEPSPGVYNWASLDSRVALIRQSGATPVITLAGAPDWMKGGEAGTTDWANIEEAPLPSHDEDFARLAVAVARRYPSVTHFMVWNELKGMWDPQSQTWDAPRYTTLYNDVYDALKAYNPAIQVGGPYVQFDSYVGPQRDPSSVHGTWGTLDQRSLDVVTYWLKHMHGADFIAIDAYSDPVDQATGMSSHVADAKLAAISAWVGAQTSLPIWWAEVYPANPSMDLASQSAAVADAVLDLAWAGDSEMLLWGPQADGQACAECLWTDPTRAGGGQPTDVGRVVVALDKLLRPGATLHQVSTGSPSVTGLRIDQHLVLVNDSPDPVHLESSGSGVALTAYQVLIS